MADVKEVLIEARVLQKCDFGQCGEVVKVTEKAVKSNPTQLDADPDAVAYAKKVIAKAKAKAEAEAEGE